MSEAYEQTEPRLFTLGGQRSAQGQCHNCIFLQYLAYGPFNRAGALPQVVFNVEHSVVGRLYGEAAAITQHRYKITASVQIHTFCFHASVAESLYAA